ETILLAAQAEAGWGAWARVDSLLTGRDWLDRVSGGYGWNLLGRSRLELELWGPGSEALGRYLAVAQDAGERERGMAEMRRASALRQAGDAAGAAAAYDRAAPLLPQLGDWIAVFAADALAMAGDTAGVRQRLERTDSALARDWGWRIRYRAHLKANDVPGAQRIAEAAAHALDQASARAEAWTLAGQARLQRGDTARTCARSRPRRGHRPPWTRRARSAGCGTRRRRTCCASAGSTSATATSTAASPGCAPTSRPGAARRSSAPRSGSRSATRCS